MIRLDTIPYHPTTIVDRNTDELKGFYVDTFRDQFKTIGLDVEFVETKWGTFAGALQSNQFDVFVGGSFATPLRALALNFSKPFIFMGYSAGIGKSDVGRFKTLADIDQPGVKVAVAMGSGGHEYAKQKFSRADNIALDTGDLTAPFMEVLSGRADVGVQEAVATSQVAAKHDNLVDLFGATPLNVLPVSLAVAQRNQQLLSFLNTFIDYMNINGKWRNASKLYAKDLGGFFVINPNYESLGGTGRTGMIQWQGRVRRSLSDRRGVGGGTQTAIAPPPRSGRLRAATAVAPIRTPWPACWRSRLRQGVIPTGIMIDSLCSEAKRDRAPPLLRREPAWRMNAQGSCSMTLGFSWL
jgi:polar amino acid transport system substrate-binding protein